MLNCTGNIFIVVSYHTNVFMLVCNGLLCVFVCFCFVCFTLLFTMFTNLVCFTLPFLESMFIQFVFITAEHNCQTGTTWCTQLDLVSELHQVSTTSSSAFDFASHIKATYIIQVNNAKYHWCTEISSKIAVLYYDND